ncbi:luciferase [Pandoraea terrae]|uniref:Luciferase n=1 Tax=Pandoraea terrae TaxID=1537710 RepID=A0A5E4Z4S5_9BURK|nr:LLM class flavin-dependent oxidoreductase [Pandoraea terrae]VVE55657.1 luciferase [Pandoraea terrae]
MKCGIFHTPYILPKRTAREVFDWSLQLAVVADQEGFADFMIGEHYTLAWENIPCPDIVIGAAAPLTKNIRFAPMAHLLPYHKPATLASRVGWLSQVLEGRYFLGVAPGGHHTDAILQGFPGIMELQPQMFEALELMERVWERKPFQHKGTYCQAGYPGEADFPGYVVEYADNSPWGGWKNMEVAVTGLTKNSSSLKWAGERNYSPISFFGGTEVMKSHWDTWAAAAASKGFATDRSRFRICRDILIADSDAEAKRRAINGGLGESWRNYLGAIYKKFNLFQGIIDDSGTGIHPSEINMDFLAEHVWLCGSPETVARKLERIAEKAGGWGQIAANSHDYIDDLQPWIESLQRLAHEVVPKVSVL